MIDTDKYEGHTPAPWDGILSGYFTIEELKGIDKTLMQDAPLLLQEVKRLQYWDEEMDRVIATLDEHNWASSDGDVHDIVTHILAEVKRLRKQLQLLHDTWFTDAEMASDVDERMTTLLKGMIE